MSIRNGIVYVGGGRWIPAVPARDMGAEELEELGLDPAELVASGMYTPARGDGPSSTPRAGATKQVPDGAKE